MQYTREMVLEKIGKMFPGHEPDAVLAILDGCASQAPERERVQLGILKLCDGQLDELPGLIAVANQDPRDIMGWAEFPHQMQAGQSLSAQKMQAIREEDRSQWLAWLQK